MDGQAFKLLAVVQLALKLQMEKGSNGFIHGIQKHFTYITIEILKKKAQYTPRFLYF